MTENKYKITINACFLAYIVQAIVNNFVPLLFITFQREFDIPLSKITLLITFNFLIQLNTFKIRKVYLFGLLVEDSILWMFIGYFII